MTVVALLNLESPSCQDVPELQLWREVLLLAIMDCRGQTVGVKPHDKGSVQWRARAWVFPKVMIPEVLSGAVRCSLLIPGRWIGKPFWLAANGSPIIAGNHQASKASRKTRIDKHERLGDCLAPFEVQNFLISPTDSRSPSNSSDGHHLCFGRAGWRPKRESLSLKTLMTSGL